MDTTSGIVMTDEMREALKRAQDPRLADFNPSMRVEEQNLVRRAREELKTRGMTRVSKNAKCPCGSGKRFKNCHRTPRT
jgi:uncharacterized protein YecA (UPF0149 family)